MYRQETVYPTAFAIQGHYTREAQKEYRCIKKQQEKNLSNCRAESIYLKSRKNQEAAETLEGGTVTHMSCWLHSGELLWI